MCSKFSAGNILVPKVSKDLIEFNIVPHKLAKVIKQSNLTKGPLFGSMTTVRKAPDNLYSAFDVSDFMLVVDVLQNKNVTIFLCLEVFLDSMEPTTIMTYVVEEHDNSRLSSLASVYKTL